MAALLVEVVGWVGALVMLLAYAQNARGRLAATSRTYVVLNLVGSAALTLNGAVNHAWPSAVLNVLWLSVALAGWSRRRSGSASGYEVRGTGPELAEAAAH